MRSLLAAFGLAIITLAGCEEIPQTEAAAPTTVEKTAPSKSGAKLSPAQAARAFVSVKNRMEPVIERECRQRTSGVSCDFRILVDDNRKQPPNAYQTLDDQGRPIIAFTIGLIEDARNVDEIAFVMGHEAAHHIKGHLKQTRDNAISGAVILAGLATLTGGDQRAVESAQELGFEIGARTYSKEFELEADELGTILTIRSGYDPLRGAQFFNRIPDPGDKFLGTHPPNAQRIEIVKRTAALN